MGSGSSEKNDLFKAIQSISDLWGKFPPKLLQEVRHTRPGNPVHFYSHAHSLAHPQLCQILDKTDLLFGELIMEQGAEAHWLGILVSGGCEISVGGHKQAMAVGTVFGVAEFMGAYNARRLHSITTNAKSTIVSISFERCVATCTLLAFSVVAVVNLPVSREHVATG